MGACGRGGRRWISVGQGSGFLFYKAWQMEYARHTGGGNYPHFTGENKDSDGMEANVAGKAVANPAVLAADSHRRRHAVWSR